MSTSRSYTFGEYRLDLARGALLKSGADVKLRPKSFEVLRLLIERHGQLVTKDELLDAVWGHTVVTEDSIFQCLIDVRRAIGDESQQMIKTVPRRGYIFDVPVSVSDAASREYGVTVSDIAAPEREVAGRSSGPSPPRSGPRLPRSGLLAAAFISLVPVAIWWGLEGRGKEAAPPVERSAAQAPHNSIAVLPFVDLSPAGDSAYFSDGLSEEVLNLLSQAPELRVIARTSSFSFRDRDADIATIARTLGVRYLLEGSVRREGRRVRITAQLIEASSSSHLWSAVYERELDDVFAVQIEIAAAVADALETRLAAPPGQQAAPADPWAHEEVLRGQFFYHRRGPGDLERALRSFERAVALDANYARAWAGVAAIVCIETGEGLMPRATGLPRLLEAATRTVALDPRMAAGHFRLCCYYDLLGEERLAEDHLTRR
jgi:TolB-like protein/DNA-binding winged helix-turn-helix (wHTH) protein